METLTFILKILGSLGVFLYGMKVMSEGIQQTAGERMRKIMATMTHNRVTGVLTGVTTTGLIQSSSATTVMVVSFVNAGLLTLVESIGVIMGANLGTTLTAWIIATVGKFSLSKIALPIIGLGLPFFFVGKNKLKSFGQVLIGFGLLFYGLHLLKESVPDLKVMIADDATDAMKAQAKEIQDFIARFSGKGYLSALFFLAVGVLLTLIVQSSSAAMAITVTITIQGWISFQDSAAIVLGENIGTTVTAWLASIGASSNAKRAARAHFLFNILGVVWMLIIFFQFTAFAEWLGSQLPDSFRTEKHDTPVGFNLAIFHTLFNLANICLLIGFVPLIAKLVTRWVKDDPVQNGGSPRLQFISQNLVRLGELKISEAENATRELASISREMFQGYLTVLKNPHKDLTEEVKRLKTQEDDADVLTHDITEYLIRTSAAEITTENARAVTRMIRIASELEEISDTIYRLVQITRRKYRKDRSFDEQASKNITAFSEKIVALMNLYCEVLETDGATEENVKKAEKLERETDRMRKRFNKEAMQRMSENAESVKTEMITIEMHNQFELIANYALNVVQTAFYLLHEDEVPDKYESSI
ncbi:MAG: Na/Pi cotransporter family protein [Verrucomicrobiales bacterium]|nr:Na/Pi cotransporter family protein [Verrucomicrobiales bacterium]